MAENPQKKLVTQIALEDLQRRRALIAPQVDANIEEVLRICEDRLKEAGEPSPNELAPKKDDAYWDAEFNFWHKIITEEVERFRFNEGYEPITLDLYDARNKGGLAYVGQTQIGHVLFNVEGRWATGKNGKKS